MQWVIEGTIVCAKAGQVKSMPQEAQSRQKSLKTLVQKFGLSLETSTSSQPDYLTYLQGITYNLHVPQPWPQDTLKLTKFMTVKRICSLKSFLLRKKDQ